MKHGNGFLDLTGQRFGRLDVKSYAGSFDGKAHWLCMCDCGVEKIVCGKHLRLGKTVSCSCYSRDLTLARCTTHGLSKTPEYWAWKAMIGRCHFPHHPNFKNYGGRGIAVCERWLNSFENFLADMGLKPSPELSIERRNNNGNYEPGNCKWGTEEEQRNNKRSTIRIDFEGQCMTAAEASEKFGISRITLRSRIRRGWTDRQAVETAPIKGGRYGYSR